MTSVRLATLTQRRSLILLCLGFASGLPLALTSGTLQAWMTVAGLDLKTIGFFSLVGQAYVFKFLWSPVMDRYSPPLMGRRRGWLVICQALLIVGLLAMGTLDPARNLAWLAALAIWVVFCSASQDIVFDSYKTDLLSALAAVGRVYVGPLAGWFVELHGWAWFYLFSVAVSFPGLGLLMLCRTTLTATQPF